MTTKWGGLWPPQLRFHPRKICSDQGSSGFACALRQPIAVPPDTTAPLNALISWKSPCSERSYTQTSTASHPSRSNGLALLLWRTPSWLEISSNSVLDGILAALYLGTESNLGHYASVAKNKKIGRFRPIDFLCLQIGYSDPAGGH